jgi:SagB-type dehydrogenase family enzyme
MHDAYDYQECFATRQGFLAPSLNDPTRTDWADAPRRHALRGRCFEVPLPRVVLPHARPAHEASAMSLATLARWLWFTTGLLRRKLEIDWNQSAAVLVRAEPLYARGTPSGGGLYPVEVYVVAKGVRGLEDGVYQYAEGRAALWRLRSGAHSHHLGRLLGQPVGATSLHIVLVGRFWKSAFKYKAFAYQATTEDVGAMLATLLRLAMDDAVGTEVTYDFHDRGVDALLGLDDAMEASLVVVTVGRDTAAAATTPEPERGSGRLPPVAPYLERSRVVHLAGVINQVHAASRRPALSLTAPASHCAPMSPRIDDCPPGSELRLPPALRRPPLTYATLTARRSAMGPLDPRQPLKLTDLSALVAAMMAPYTSDTGGADQSPGSVRLFILSRNVEGLDAGVHAVHDAGRALTRHAGVPGSFRLQQLYYLENYNLANASLVLFIVGRKRLARAHWGQRSLRICNAEAGLLAQRAYLSCAQQGLACGAFLGFDAPLADNLLGLERDEESTLLCMLVSRPPESIARFVFRLD